MTRFCDEWYEYSNAATLNLPILLSKYPLKPIWIVLEGRHALLNTTPDGTDLLASSFGRFAFKDWVLFTWQLGDWACEPVWASRRTEKSSSLNAFWGGGVGDVENPPPI